MSALDPIGTVIEGKYRIESRIGAGGFGTVFRARHLGLGHPVAVKLLNSGTGEPSPDDLDKFRQEAASAFRLKHPNAVAVYDFGISPDGLAYLVMELLEGQPLSKEIQTVGTMSPARCAEILIPVCGVLAEAHAEGIIHRDIKPENIFLSTGKLGEQVKVVDFGIAKLTDHTISWGNAPATSLVGTPAFMSPERLQNLPYDGRADIYSLGVTLFQMLSGRVPFKATDSSNIAAILLMHVNNQPPSFSEIGVAVPPEMETIVRATLEKDPTRRPQAAELAHRLAEITGVRVSGFNPAVRSEPVPTTRPTPHGVPTPTQSQIRPGINPASPATSVIRSQTPPSTPTEAPTRKERTDETRNVPTRPLGQDSLSEIAVKGSESRRFAAIAASALGAVIFLGSGIWTTSALLNKKAATSVPQQVSVPSESSPIETTPQKKNAPSEKPVEANHRNEATTRGRIKPAKPVAVKPAENPGSGPPPGVPADLWHGKKPKQ